MTGETDTFLRRQWRSRLTPRTSPGDAGSATGAAARHLLAAGADPSHSGRQHLLVKRRVLGAKVMCMELEPPPKGVDTASTATNSTERERMSS
jgi:hypothetical protein